MKDSSGYVLLVRTQGTTYNFDGKTEQIIYFFTVSTAVFLV